MLRGRCSCAISGRPGISSRQKTPLTPLFPLHPGKLPVSALFPLLTQKQGGTPSAGMTNRSILESLPARSSPCGPFSAAPLFSVLSVYSVVSLLSAAFPCSPLATRHSPLSLTIPVHPRGSSVSPIIPALTQNMGGGGYLSSLLLRPLLPQLPSTPLLSFHSPLRLCVLRVLCGGSDPLFLLATRHSSLATLPNHSRTIGNCGPTNRTRSYIYHYITYRCRRADIFAPRAARLRRTGPTQARKTQETDLKVGHYISDPKTQVENRTWGTRCQTSPRENHWTRAQMG